LDEVVAVLVVAVDDVIGVAVVVVVVEVEAGVSLEVAVVVIVEVEPVSSTTFGCSEAVVVVVVSVVDSSFLQPPRNRVADAVAAIRKRARDFFIF
jgi:hypothetical protein